MIVTTTKVCPVCDSPDIYLPVIGGTEITGVFKCNNCSAGRDGLHTPKVIKQFKREDGDGDFIMKWDSDEVEGE